MLHIDPGKVPALIRAQTRPQDNDTWTAAGTLPRIWASTELTSRWGGTRPPGLFRGPTLYALEPGRQQAASTIPGQPCPGPQASLGASSGQARPLTRGAVPRKKPALLWPLEATCRPHRRRLASQPHCILVTALLCLSFLICEVGFLWPVHRAWRTEGSQAYSNSPNELTLPHCS